MLKIVTLKLTGFMLTGAMLFFLLGSYWGMWGRISAKHFDLLLTTMTPWQKTELADALNYYYNRNFITRHTSGYILRCSNSSESMKSQFNWFYRDAVSATVSSMPDYHTIVKEAFASSFGDEFHPRPDDTFKYELALARKYKNGAFLPFTGKDAVGWGFSAVSLTVRIAAWGINPIFGAALSLASLIQSAMSDINKAIPGIITFMQIRSRNFLYSFAILWGLSGWFIIKAKTFKPPAKPQRTASAGKSRGSTKKSRPARKPKPKRSRLQK
jgi:hypothetical protein